jgi:hypothetical protein
MMQFSPQRSRSSTVDYLRDDRFRDRAQKPCEKELILTRPDFVGWIEACNNSLRWCRMRFVKKTKKIMSANMWKNEILPG